MNIEKAKTIVEEYERIHFQHVRSGQGFIPKNVLPYPVDTIKYAIKRIFFSEYIDRKNFTQQRGNHFMLRYVALATYISEEQCKVANPILFGIAQTRYPEREIEEANKINESVLKNQRILAGELMLLLNY
jgi:hypothetical protein